MKLLLTAALIAATLLSVPAQAGPMCEALATFAGAAAKARLAGVSLSKAKKAMQAKTDKNDSISVKVARDMLPILEGVYDMNPPLSEEEATMVYYLACKREIGDQ
jgi:hypothetical protein